MIAFTDGVIISSKTNDFEQLTYSTKENYQRCYNYLEKSNEPTTSQVPPAANHMSIINLKNEASTIPRDSMQTNSSIASSHLMSSVVAYKPVQSVIQSINSNGHSTPLSVPESMNAIERSNSNNPIEYATNALSQTSSNPYFVLRSSANTNEPINNQPPTFRERSIEETEAAHDLLSLSQSLPPLPAPCVVTILHPVTNYNANSPDVQEITTNRQTEYITYTSNRNIQYTFDETDLSDRNKKNVSTQFDADMLPDDSSSSGEFFQFSNSIANQFFSLKLNYILNPFHFDRCKSPNNTLNTANIRIVFIRCGIHIGGHNDQFNGSMRHIGKRVKSVIKNSKKSKD